MSNIINDIVEDIEVKPSKSKLVIKWVVRISVGLISVAFVFGQLKMSHLNKLDDMQKSLETQSKEMGDLKQEMTDGFTGVNDRIDKVYDDGFKAFNDFQQYNNKQLGMIIDYSKSDKEMLKRMLEITTMEKTKSVENEIQQAKNESVIPEFNIAVKPISGEKKAKNGEFMSCIQSVAVNSTDTAYYVQGATKDFMNKLDRNKYRVEDITNSVKYPGLYDFRYYNKY
jgi:hypothetical protein